MLQPSFLFMKSLNKYETPIFLSVVCSVFPNAIFLAFILLHCSWCFCRVAAVERLPEHHHSADYISFPMESLDPLWYI